MNAVVFYSKTGQSATVAKYFSKQLSYPIVDLETCSERNYRNLVLVFPVYCQSLPVAVKDFLKKSQIENLTVIATYGKMCAGNVLYEIQRKYQRNIVAGAYLPTKHAYLATDSAFCEYERLAPILEKIKKPTTVRIPKRYKNPFAGFFPNWRSRIGLKICKTDRCDRCGLCTKGCSLRAIDAGVTNSKCIRCLKCVTECPKQALEIKLRLPLKLYLQKKKKDEVILYI